MVKALPVCPVPITIPLTTGMVAGAVDLTLLIKLAFTVELTKPVSSEIPAMRALDVSILMVLFETVELRELPTLIPNTELTVVVKSIEFWEITRLSLPPVLVAAVPMA